MLRRAAAPDDCSLAIIRSCFSFEQYHRNTAHAVPRPWLPNSVRMRPSSLFVCLTDVPLRHGGFVVPQERLFFASAEEARE